MELVIASKQSIAILWGFYRQQYNFHALIGAAIEGKQRAVIYCDTQDDPQAFFVTTPFGFSQVICLQSTDAIVLPWFERVAYALLNPQVYDFPATFWLLQVDSRLAKLLTLEQMHHSKRMQWDLPHDHPIAPVNHPHIKPLEQAAIVKVTQAIDFEIDGRFWPTAEDYSTHGFGYYWQEAGAVLGACYACAVSEGCAEIDITTVDAHQGKGIGFKLAQAFINQSLIRGLAPKWDCYTDNVGSVKLAKALGFVPREAYRFMMY